jgi:mycothiol synthase
MDATTKRPMTELELLFRAYRPETDPAEVARIFNAASVTEGLDSHSSPEDFANFFGHPDDHFDASRDVVMVEHDGAVVAYGWQEWVDTTDGLREHRLRAFVDPEWTRRGIGTRLLHWQEARSRETAAAYPTDRPRFFGTWADDNRIGKRALLAKEGYTETRWFFEMRRDDLDHVDVPPMPEGLEVRPIGTDRESLWKLFTADAEAFEDHWGGFNFNEAVFEEILEDPNFDPSLYVVAWDGDEIAGAVINALPLSENKALGRHRGWLESVFVRRPWRKRGLAGALVARSLVVLREAGMDHALLGVDADNPTGALGVYERAGFVVMRRSTAYRKSMEAA